jgi:DNA repair exonuclease SbcCD ATPase subunit
MAFLTVAIPTMNRWSFLKDSLPIYLERPEVGEIVICDEKITQLTTEIATDKQRLLSLKETYNKIGTQDEICPVCLREIKDHDTNYIEEEKNNIKQQIENNAIQLREKAKKLENINDK